MKKLNKKFLRKYNKSTDVLSFPNYYTGKLYIWSRKFAPANLYELIDLMTAKSQGYLFRRYSNMTMKLLILDAKGNIVFIIRVQ